MTTEITARDKLLLYVVGMLAFIFFFVQFMLTPALEASDEAAASLAEAQQAQIAMQETIALAGTNAAAKTESWAALQQANANYYGLLSSSDLDTLVSNLELGHDLGPVSLDISAIDTQSLTGYAASTQADDTAAPTDINSTDPFYTMLDDLAAQYPSVQLKSVQIDHAAYTNASGATTNTATYTVQLNVILCDKESVVS